MPAKLQYHNPSVEDEHEDKKIIKAVLSTVLLSRVYNTLNGRNSLSSTMLCCSIRKYYEFSIRNRPYQNVSTGPQALLANQNPPNNMWNYSWNFPLPLALLGSCKLSSQQKEKSLNYYLYAHAPGWL